MRTVRRLFCNTDRILLAFGSLALTLKGVKWPNKCWDHRIYLFVVAVALVFVVGLIQPFDRICVRRYREDRDEARRLMHEALVDAANASGINERDLAVHLWLVRRTPFPWLHNELKRIYTARVLYHPLTR